MKVAAPRWVKELAAGNLSPQAEQTIAKSLPEGSFRYMKNLGHGEMQIADKVFGNVGGRQGLMVRKVPRLAVPSSLQEHYQPLVDASAAIENLSPGASVPYFKATNKGVFQELADMTAARPADVKARIASTRGVLEPHGFTDMAKHENFSPSGQLIDFAKSPTAGGVGALDIRGMRRSDKIDQRVLPPQLQNKIDSRSRALGDEMTAATSAWRKWGGQYFPARMRKPVEVDKAINKLDDDVLATAARRHAALRLPADQPDIATPTLGGLASRGGTR